MPVQGFVKFREHQFGRQTAFGTKSPAYRAYPFRGVPDVDLGWEDPEVDAGSIVRVVPPVRGPGELTASLEIPVVNYNDLPILHSGIFGGQVEPTGGGAAKTWLFEPSATSPDEEDLYTYEFGDDVLTDWYQFGDCVIETVEITGPEGLGALTGTVTWRMGSMSSTGSTDSPVTGTVPTPALTVDTAAVPIYLKDGGIYIASTTAGLAAGQITDALHEFTLTIEAPRDLKRWANRDKSFDIDAYGRPTIRVALEAVYSKTADTVGTGSESDAWMSDTAVNRFIRLSFESAQTISTGPDVFYAWDLDMAMRYYTRQDTESNGNTTVTLTAEEFYDPEDLEGFLVSTIVNTLTTEELGNVAS